MVVVTAPEQLRGLADPLRSNLLDLDRNADADHPDSDPDR
jgi:hypothetical protein